jgi:5-methyltetrahydrofolate--homocysteine methyltransferase
VIGTVEGDLHDIGKDLVAMMLEGAGFEVVNLGVEVIAEEFLKAAKEHEADIIGMSALLTTTMIHMPEVIDGRSPGPDKGDDRGGAGDPRIR